MFHSLFENEPEDGKILSSFVAQNADESKARANNYVLSSVGSVDDAVYKGYETKKLSGRRGPRHSSTFPAKLHKILSCLEFRHIITWTSNGFAWRVLQPKLFEETIMPKYFAQQSKYSSFTRQVNGWGFKRITQGIDRNCYCHPLFKANMPHLTTRMTRLSVSTSKRIFEKSMKKSPTENEVENSQAHTLSGPGVQISQGREYSQRSNFDSQFFQDTHQNKYYYNTQEHPQVLRSNGSSYGDHYYDSISYQKCVYDGTCQHSYHDTYHFCRHDCYDCYRSSQASIHRQGLHIECQDKTFNEADQCEYHQADYHRSDEKHC